MRLRKSRHRLTEREVEVAYLVSHGHSNPDIGHELEITIDTVKRHVSNIMNKLSANNRADVARLITADQIPLNAKPDA